MLALAIIFALLAGALGSPADLQASQDAKALCEYKEVDLRTSTQLQLIARHMNQAGILGSCPEQVSRMILDLSKFLRETQANVCSKEAATSFKSYYLKYIDKSNGISNNAPKKMPKRFKRFVLAVGMQMSNKCKKNMLDVITRNEGNLLNPEDVVRLEPWINERGPLGQMLSSMNKPGEIVLPADLAALMSRNDSLRVEKMFIQSRATMTIKSFQETCRKRFQPIYEPLILPITLLSGIGFDYHDQELKVEFKKRETKKIVADWSSVVFICEALKFVEPVEFLDPVQGDTQEANDDAPDGGETASDLVSPDSTPDVQFDPSAFKEVGKNQLRMLTEDEAKAIKEQIKLNPKLGHLFAEESLEKLDRKEFSANSDVPLGDLILDKSNGKLTKAVSSFKDNKTRMERVKGRMISRALVTLRSLLKKRKVIVFATSSAKVAWRRLTTKREILTKDEINKLLVETVEQMADKTMEPQSRWTTNEVVGLVVLLICSIAAFAVTTWVVYLMVVAAISAVTSILSGR